MARRTQVTLEDIGLLAIAYCELRDERFRRWLAGRTIKMAEKRERRALDVLERAWRDYKRLKARK